MKTKIYFYVLALATTIFAACSSSESGDGGGSGSSINVQSGVAIGGKSDIVGAKSLAVGRKAIQPRTTRAEGNATAENALLKVSDDMKFIEVTYTFNVEVVARDENGKEIIVKDASETNEPELKTIIEQVKTKLRIVPNFIFNIGDNILWLSNCFYEVEGYDTMEEGPVKKALTVIRDSYNTSHHSTHGGQFLVRKSDGTIFEWDPQNGAPNDMDDGYKDQNTLNGWLHSIGSHIYVREGGYRIDGQDHTHPNGRVLKITDQGASLKYEQIIPAVVDDYGVAYILPANNNLGVVCREQNSKYPVPYIYNLSTNQIKRLTGIDVDENTRWSLASLAGVLYAVRNHHQPNGQPEDPNRISLYAVDVNTAQVVGTALCEITGGGAAFDDDKFFAKGYATSEQVLRFIMSDAGQSQNNLVAMNPTASTDPEKVKTSPLPDHYPDNINIYVKGIGCGDVTNDGFYVCDLNTLAPAEYVPLDWTNAGQYQSLSRTYTHFEAANMSIKYEAIDNGSKIALWVPITGDDRGKVKVYTGTDGSNYDVDVVVDIVK